MSSAEDRAIEDPAYRESRLPLIEDLEAIRESADIPKVAGWLKAQFDSGALNPLADKQTIELLRAQNETFDQMAQKIHELSGKEDFGLVPDIESFCQLKQPYRGADGKDRNPLPKFVPVHMMPFLTGMQRNYEEWLLERPEHTNEKKRPGLIVESAFRSDYYQLGICIKEILRQGADTALKAVSLPVMSEHADPDTCAIDFVGIGDRDGAPIPFEQTLEFRWLVLEEENCINFAFWPSYSPDPHDPLAPMGTRGIIVEPWHFRFTMDSEVALDLMRSNRVRESFATRAEHIGNTALQH